MENVKENQEITPINPLVFERFDAIIKSIVSNGSACITGTGGAGKTILSMWLARRIMCSPKSESNEYKLMMIEILNNYMFKFDKIPYINYSEYIDRTGKIQPPNERNLILNMNSMNRVSLQKTSLRNLVLDEFNRMNALNREHGGVNPYGVFYFIDEIPVVLDRYSLVGEKNEDMYSIVTTGRNVKMYFVGMGRRLVDFPTSFVESCSTFVFGVIDGENDLGKIKNMYPNKKIKEKVLEGITNLTPRSFIFYDKKARRIDEIGMPEWVPQGKPYKYANYVPENPKGGYVKKLFGW